MVLMKDQEKGLIGGAPFSQQARGKSTESQKATAHEPCPRLGKGPGTAADADMYQRHRANIIYHLDAGTDISR